MPQEILDHCFAVVDNYELLCDILIPDAVENPPLVMYIHGGGWRNQTHKNNRLPWLVDHGYAVASVHYRLIDRAIFPAQIHDVKAALRYLRAHADEFGYDAQRIAVAGGSAGACLAMLLGLSVGQLQGSVGEFTHVADDVRAIINYYGPSDFILRAETQPESATSPDRGSFKLLHGEKTGTIDWGVAKEASPVTYITKNSAPLISFHGKPDATVLVDQAERIHALYEEHGLIHELYLDEEAGHSDQRLFEGAYREALLAFLAQHL